MRRFFVWGGATICLATLIVALRMPRERNRREEGSESTARLTTESLPIPGKSNAGLANSKSADQPVSARDEQNRSAVRLAEGPITDEEIQSFAQSLEQAVLQQDVEAVADHIDWEKLAVLANGVAHPRDLPLKGKGRLVRMADCLNGLLKQIVDGTKNGGGFRFLRILKSKPTGSPLFGMYSENGGFNYFAWHLSRRWGAVVAVDVDVYMLGEPYSLTLNRFYLQSKVFIAPADAAEKRRRTQISADRMLIASAATSNSQDNREVIAALEAYDRLPESIQQDKNVMLLWAGISAKLSGASGERALAAFERRFPDDSSLTMLQINVFSASKNYQRAHQAIDKLDRLVGGDPFLQVMHSRTYRAAGELDLAIVAAQAAVDSEPRLLVGYSELLAAYLAQQDFTRTANLLTYMRDEVQLPVTAMLSQPFFKEFIESPEYANWMKQEPMNSKSSQ